ncbi:hypothetical protein [Ruegeria sp. HKCCA4812]|uniref:hypothetical protein n=1 Tax=Ruegeria sp. HKCCA4812 TaxID=2682993 RepID=UPI00148956D8|nr:hypothetical protein [Ruegeria sp. HKCCA4812]
MEELARQVAALNEKVEALQRQHAFDMRQMEIAFHQSEMQLQLQIREILRQTGIVRPVTSPSHTFIRDTLWKRIVFRKTGKPKKLFKVAFFKSNGKARGYAKRIVFKKDGSPRPHFVPELQMQANKK